MQSIGRRYCPNIGIQSLRVNIYDAITSSSDLSTSDHEDTAGIGCESEGTWFYGTTMIVLWGICADSYESAICGFWVGGIVLNLGVI